MTGLDSVRAKAGIMMPKPAEPAVPRIAKYHSGQFTPNSCTNPACTCAVEQEWHKIGVHLNSTSALVQNQLVHVNDIFQRRKRSLQLGQKRVVIEQHLPNMTMAGLEHMQPGSSLQQNLHGLSNLCEAVVNAS